MLDRILEMFDEVEILKADGYDDCIIGYEQSGSSPIRLVYSVKKVMSKLIEEGMEEIDAIEHFEFNILGSYVGEQTPVWCHDNF
jgi:hypothetical protein